MANKKYNRQPRRKKADTPAACFVDETTGEALFEQPLVADGTSPLASPAEQRDAPKGGKAKAKIKNLGKAKLTIIAERIKRSTRKK